MVAWFDARYQCFCDGLVVGSRHGNLLVGYFDDFRRFVISPDTSRRVFLLGDSIAPRFVISPLKN